MVDLIEEKPLWFSENHPTPAKNIFSLMPCQLNLPLTYYLTWPTSVSLGLGYI